MKLLLSVENKTLRLNGSTRAPLAVSTDCTNCLKCLMKVNTTLQVVKLICEVNNNIVWVRKGDAHLKKSRPSNYG